MTTLRPSIRAAGLVTALLADVGCTKSAPPEIADAGAPPVASPALTLADPTPAEPVPAEPPAPEAPVASALPIPSGRKDAERDVAAMRQALEARLASGSATVEEIRMLRALCRHQNDRDCVKRTTARLDAAKH
jgi:hypothetical protein